MKKKGLIIRCGFHSCFDWVSSGNSSFVKWTCRFWGYLKGVWSQVSAGLVSLVTNNKMRGNGFRLHEGRLRLNIRRNFTEMVLNHWNRLPREPGSVSKRRRCGWCWGTWFSSRLDRVREWSDSMILKVFSDWKDSIFLSDMMGLKQTIVTPAY